MNWYLDVLTKKYATFSGRARRKEFWMFALINFLVALGLRLLGDVLGTQLLGTIYSLAVLVPSIALSVRRLHDVDRSGWFLLLIFIPILGWLVLLFFYVLEGTRGPNSYGPDPKGEIF